MGDDVGGPKERVGEPEPRGAGETGQPAGDMPSIRSESLAQARVWPRNGGDVASIRSDTPLAQARVWTASGRRGEHCLSVFGSSHSCAFVSGRSGESSAGEGAAERSAIYFLFKPELRRLNQGVIEELLRPGEGEST